MAHFSGPAWAGVGATVLAVVFAIAVLRSPRWMARFAPADLVLVALTFTLVFVAVSLPSLLLSGAAALLLGPLQFLVEGLFYKLMLYLLLGALLVWVPRAGVFTLFYCLWLLAQALLNGYYGLTTLLFPGVVVVLMECALWLVGVTRGRQPPVWAVALVIGCAEALVVTWSLHLMMLLFRLNLAGWYVALQAGSAGAYALLGISLGMPLGRRLLPLRQPQSASRLPGSPARDPLPTPHATPDTSPAPESGVDAAAPARPLLQARGLRFAYGDSAAPALADVDLELRAGEIVLLAGPTGCGKTTLLHALQGMLIHQGSTPILLQGRAQAEWSSLAWAQRCALLAQHPAQQCVRLTVGEEVQLGVDLAVSAGRVAPAQREGAFSQALERFALAPLAPRRMARLSGGELQRTVLAALLAGHPAVLLLDEPLAHLDECARADLLHLLRGWARAGMAILVAEHRLAPLLPLAQRVLVMEAGRIVWQGAPRAFAASPLGQVQQAESPAPVWTPGAPAREASAIPLPRPGPAHGAAPPLLRVQGLSYRHGRGEPYLLRGAHAEIHRGQAIALEGWNGAGKSTLLELLVGLRKPTEGAVLAGGASSRRLSWPARARLFGYLPQQPDLLLHAPTVADELATGPRCLHWPAAQVRMEVQRWLESLGLPGGGQRFPQLLSRGERQRLALAALLITGPVLLLLDEPFSGQDAGQCAWLRDRCQEFLAAAPQRALVISTHDVEQTQGLCSTRWLLRGATLHVEPLSGSPRAGDLALAEGA